MKSNIAVCQIMYMLHMSKTAVALYSHFILGEYNVGLSVGKKL